MSVSKLLQTYQQLRRERKLPELIKQQIFDVKQNYPSCGLVEPGFRVLQWNMLAQALSQGRDNFVKCPAEALAWDNRKLHIIEEILIHDPTIVCLEEVDQFKFLQTELGKAGYNGTFFMKPASPCLDVTPNFGPDGCAMFWKTADIETLNIENYILKDTENYPTNQICILSHMKLKKNNQNIFVAVTHLKAKKNYHSLRHEQSKDLVKILKEKCADKPVILCGDLNADPTEKAYNELISCDLGLVSAYTFLDESRKEPEFTTLKIRGSPLGPAENCSTIDYVLFSQSNLVATSLMKLPGREEIGENLLPSLTFPSDHLSLIVDFKLIK